MPQNFAPRKIISTIRKRKHIPDAHLQELERLIKDTDNFKHFTETQKNDLIYLNRKSQRVNRYHSNQKMIGKKTTMKKGGKVVDDNTAMVLSQNKAIAHHTEELGKALNKNERVDAWVVGKMERASTDISDVTHYIDGKTEYADGGNIESKYVVVETDKMGKKRIMGTYYDLTSAEVYAMMKNDFMLKGRSVSIEDGEGKIVKRYEKGGEIEMTPLVGKDGERRIDAKAIDRLEMLARELPQTKYANIDKNGRYIPKRKQLHKKIVDGFKKNKPCITNRQPIAILTGGAPASGKSTFIKKYVDLDPDKVYHIDADEVRAMLPEFKGWNASQTHLETSDIVTKLIDSIGVPCEFDLIYDGTMNRADKYTDLVNKLHNFGYKVFIIYISIPKELSIERSRERYKKSGRYVPKEVIDKVYSTGLIAFEDVAKNMADGYVRIDGVSGDIIEKGGMEMPKNIEYGKGGKIGFEGLSDKVAKNYEGKSVKPEYRKLYGKTYSKEEAKEVGDKVASKVYRQQIAKMEMGGEVGDNALVLSANKMGYIVEVGNDTYTLRFPDGTQSVFRESELQIMNDDEYFADGGDTNKQWVVYVNNDQNIIGTYDSERLAKRMMKEAWNNGDYESVGMGLKSDAYSEEYYAKGGDTSKYNYGRSWHMDKRKFNKSESYELPMNTRKKEMGGDLGKDYEEYEMVVLTKDENGKSHNYRFLVSARNIAEAKEIATDLWANQFGDMNETLYKVMSDAKYRMDYGLAEGGMMAKGGKNTILNDDQLMMLKYISDRNKGGEDEEKYITMFFEAETPLTRFDLEFYKDDLINLGYLADLEDTYLVTPSGEEYLKKHYNAKVLKSKMADGGQVGTWRGNPLGDGSIELLNSRISIRDNGGGYGRGRYDVYSKGDYDWRTSSSRITLLSSFDDLEEAKQYGYNNNYAKGGMMADGGSVNNGTFEVVSVMLNVYDQQGDEQLYEYLQEDQGLDIVSQELKDYRKEKGVANEYFSEKGKYYFVVFKKADLRNIIGFEKMMDEFFVPMGMRYTYSEQTKMSMGGYMADGGELNPKIILSFSFNTDNISLNEVKRIVEGYSKDWRTSGDISQVNFYVTLKENDANDLVKELKSYGYFYDLEKTKSRYAKGGMMGDGGELKKGDKIVVLGKEFEFVRHEMDSSQGYDEERVILKNEDGIRSYPKDMVEAYSQYKMAKGGTIKVGDKVRSTTFDGVEGEVVSKKDDMLFIVKNNPSPNGDMQHDVLRIGEVEKMAKGGQTNTRKYNIIDEGKVVESGVSESKVIDYANTLAFYDLMDESETGDVKEIVNFQDALNYLGMVDVEVLEVAGEGSELSKKNLYTFENLGTFADEIEFILDVNDIQFNTKGESIVAVTTSDKMKVVISDIDNLDEPEAKDIVIRTANKVLHGKYVEPTKKLYTSGMSEKTAERILKKLGVVGNAPMNEEQKSKKDERNAMVLFTPAIDKKLFEQYEEFGGDISQQDVVVKIFNPFGSGTWYIINSDPKDPNYLWGIVDLFEVEMGSISRDELVSLRIPPLGVKLERDLSFKPINAQELFTRLQDGENFKFGGNVEYKQKDFDNTIQ